MAWIDICCTKNEGGLGIRNLREVNRVYGLKLIWRMLVGESLWCKWIRANLLKWRSFWEVNVHMQSGSWMWHKMLKLRSVAKSFYEIVVGNGSCTSFWFDNWSEKGVLFDLLGARGAIDMGVGKNATVEEVLLSGRRRRKHRLEILNDIEQEINNLKIKLPQGEKDVKLWKRDSGYKKDFSTMETWNMLRVKHPPCTWSAGVWFSQTTPKYAFMTWLSVRDRMSTMDRVVKWSRGSDDVCVLCKTSSESRNHLFFACDRSAKVWEFIAKGILGNSYTTDWSELMLIISDKNREKKFLFCIRYAFQAVLYALWRERNKLKHGEKMIPLEILKREIEKGIRNRISLVRKRGVKGMEELMHYWFTTRM